MAVIVAHRGGGGDWYEGEEGQTDKEKRTHWENQMDTFAKAFAKGMPVELDVWLNADGVPVVNHDGNLLRTHGIDRDISTFTTEELAKLDPPIPTLEQVLDLAEQVSKRLMVAPAPIYIEIKSPHYSPMPPDPAKDAALRHPPVAGKYIEQEVAKIIHDRVEHHGWSYEHLPVIGFNHILLEDLKRDPANAEIGIGFSYARENFGLEEDEVRPIDAITAQSMADKAETAGAIAINPDHRLCSQALVEAAHSSGIAVNVWTVNHLDDIKRVEALEVDATISDFPLRARQVCMSQSG